MALLSSRTRSSFSANCFVSATCQTIPTVAAGRRRPNCLVTKEDQQMGTTLPRPPPTVSALQVANTCRPLLVAGTFDLFGRVTSPSNFIVAHPSSG